ncbi:thioesterase II family protein [Flavobacterium aquicola]|uniref:Surfactin synthase thioesterase subunit n=1 Tax=Flavobacterium aquicola TaxID=1682742 RepID=A0A3E0DZV8_9FLAO|nr:thioesterase domain-containing protein [Flavobacterium aquicola]REG91602.1 surfactin synthase thioesterase subunit [Flavobacterium aquicola]
MATNNKVIALPFAGGNKYSFNGIEKHVPKKIDWITLELPGRGSRFKESLLDRIDHMVDDLLSQMIPHIHDENYIIYGHSLGTLLGYELAKKITEKKMNKPMALFFTGRGAPGFNRFDNKKSILPSPLFWEEVNKIGGLPKEILECKELLDLYYPIMISDFKAIEDYDYLPMEVPFTFPIHIFMGKDEIGIGNEKTSLSGMKAWQTETSDNCTFELLEGDHFFIFKHAESIAKRISQIAMGSFSIY